MVDDDPLFPLVRKGYDRAPVDERIHTLESALEQTRSQVAGLDARILRLSGELAQAQKDARENERPSYGGLGSRGERLLRSTEQQALEVVQAERLANGATNVMRNLSKVVVCPWLTA